MLMKGSIAFKLEGIFFLWMIILIFFYIDRINQLSQMYQWQSFQMNKSFLNEYRRYFQCTNTKLYDIYNLSLQLFKMQKQINMNNC